MVQGPEGIAQRPAEDALEACRRSRGAAEPKRGRRRPARPVPDLAAARGGRVQRNSRFQRDLVRRADNSVEVLRKRHTGCLDNQKDAVNRRIEDTLGGDEDQAPGRDLTGRTPSAA